MNEVNQLEQFEIKPGVPESIKVISILSIIGCVFGLLSAMAFPFYGKLVDFVEKSGASNSDPAQIDMMRGVADNWMLYLGFTVLTSVLCLIGVIMMRKRKAQGLPLYLVGELLPIPFSIIMSGTAALKGFGLVGFVFPIIFSVLYYINRKDYTLK
jgi:hypothetical protein